MKIDRYKERVDNMLFRATFEEKHQQLSKVSLTFLYFCLHWINIYAEHELCIRSLHCYQGFRIFPRTSQGLCQYNHESLTSNA